MFYGTDTRSEDGTTVKAKRPFFSFFSRVNARIAFYRKKAKIYQAYQCSKADLHNEEYCSWTEEPGVSCEGVGAYNQGFLSNLTQFECNLEPVLAQR